MKKTLILLCLAVIATIAKPNNNIDSLTVVLEQSMAQREQFDQAKSIKIKSLTELAHETKEWTENRYTVNKQIIKEYIAYSSDSTLAYLEHNLAIAKHLNNTEMQDETNLILIGMLTSSGQYEEAMTILKNINRSTLPQKLVGEYYAANRKLYSEMGYYSSIKEHKQKYTDNFVVYEDSLLQILDPQSEDYLSIIEKKHRDARRFDQARAINDQRLAKAQVGTRSYSLVTFERALLGELTHNNEERKIYLTLSAISDIRASIKDNASLSVLAMILFSEEEIDKAHDYIQFSFEDAVFFNSRLRFMEISNYLPIITKAFDNKSISQKRSLRTMLAIISLLGLILLGAFFYIMRQNKKLSKARGDLQHINVQLKTLNNDLNHANTQLNNLNNELVESNHIKEQYIGNFLAICSNYIDKLDNLKKLVAKQIISHKVEDLLNMAKSNKIIEDELREFYENFDNTFLHIYPNFVEQFNALLVEEERIELKKGELLNTELRVFALIRLGIKDSSKISSLLRYSVNTIYNYRAKIKNKSLGPRDDFENRVMSIGAVI